MNKRKLTKEELQEMQLIKDKKFNRTVLISFCLLLMLIIPVLVFYTYWCDTKYAYRQYALYGKEIPPDLICMNGDNLQLHESLKVSYEGKTYYFCSQNCFNHLVKHYRKVAFIPDSFSSDTICKADALVGLKDRGKPQIVYFKNKKTFSQYYDTRR